MLRFIDVKEIVSQITYKPGWRIKIGHSGDRFYLQIEATTLDATGEHQPAAWKSGKRYLSRHMCKQEIVGAALGLILDAEAHEAREWFRYRGAAIYNPHLDPDALVEVARKRSSFSIRDNPMTMKEGA